MLPVFGFVQVFALMYPHRHIQHSTRYMQECANRLNIAWYVVCSLTVSSSAAQTKESRIVYISISERVPIAA